MSVDFLTIEEKMNVLAVWSGQFLIFSLKCDEHDLALLRHDFKEKINTQLGASNIAEQKKMFGESAKIFCEYLGKEFSFANEATEILSQKHSELCQMFLGGNDLFANLNELRVIDVWSGLSSCLNKNPFPLSLLDYAIECLLPIVVPDLVYQVCTSINKLFISIEADDDIIELIDLGLETIVSRICFGSTLDKKPTNELKLAILMHLPKNDKSLAMKIGYVFKLLQSRFAHMEVK